MSNEMNTPLPWTVGEWDDSAGYDCMTSGMRCGPAWLDGETYGQKRCTIASPELIARMKADANLIVKCVNAHEGLVRALQHLADLHESNMAEIGLAPIDSITLSNARAALVKVQGDGK